MGILLKVRSESGTRAKKLLVNAYNEKCFWVHNGPVLSNLRDLKHALEHMTEKQFDHHLNSKKNDFAAWVESVLADRDCALSLRKADTRAKALAAAEKALKNYAV